MKTSVRNFVTPGISKRAIRNLEGLEGLGYDGAVERTVLSKRLPNGRVFAADLSGSRVSFANIIADYATNGALSEYALNIGIILDSDSFRLRSVDTRPGDIAVMPANADVAGVHHGHNSYFVMTVDTQRLIELAEFEGIIFDPKLFAKPQIYRPGLDWAAFSTKYASNICASISDPGPVLKSFPAGNTEIAKKLLADDLIRLILHGMIQVETATVEDDPFYHNSRAVVRDVQKIMSRFENKAITLDVLVLELGIARRTLYRAVHSELGISPARFLRLYRLSRARLELVHMDSKDGSVTATALDWGFADIGRFAGEYRNYFGELPSKTLAQPADVTRVV